MMIAIDVVVSVLDVDAPFDFVVELVAVAVAATAVDDAIQPYLI